MRKQKHINMPETRKRSSIWLQFKDFFCLGLGLGLGLVSSRSWSCLGLDTLWSWSCLGLGLGGLDYKSTCIYGCPCGLCSQTEISGSVPAVISTSESSVTTEVLSEPKHHGHPIFHPCPLHTEISPDYLNILTILCSVDEIIAVFTNVH